jgi:hypothetical protein
MPEEPRTLSPRRAVGWTVMAIFVVAAVVLYFVYGRSVPPLTAEPVGESAPAVRP